MLMTILKKLIKPAWNFLKKQIFSIYAVWLLPLVLLFLAYMIFGRHQFALKWIIMFCVVLFLWLSAVVNHIGKAQSIPEEVNELAKKFKSEFNVARSKIYTAFYEVPFFIILGEPGAGKTTLIKSSGFSQLGTIDEKRDDEKKGVGGTRGCDWFIRKEIVFLDTAGLMSEDKDLWEAFLTRVRDVRPLYPINGVLVVVPIDQLCHKKEKELQSGPSIPDMPDGAQEGQFTIVPEFQYNIFGKQLAAAEESEIKSHIREKAESVKERLQEVQDILNFHLPVYVMISKCDLLAGFRDFSHVLTEAEKDKIVGLVDFQEYDKIVEQLQQWQVKRTVDNVNNLTKTWLYLENLKALKSRLHPYHEAFAEFFGGAEHQADSYLRGYFVSSCKQHMIVGGGDAYKRSRAYFVKDFFTKKVLSEQGLGRPGEEITTRKQVVTRRIKIATLASIVGVILWVVGYFLLNYGSIEKLEKRTSRLKDTYSEAPKTAKDLHLFRVELVREVKQIFDDFKKSKTSSMLFVASWANDALEVQIQKTCVTLMHRHLTKPTLEETLRKLGRQEESPWDPLAPGAKVDDLKGFVAYANRLATVYSTYKAARQNLEGFERLYQWVYERKLESEEEFPKVREVCRSEQHKESLKKELASLTAIEEEEIEKRLKPYLKAGFARMCKSKAAFPVSGSLLDCYREMAEIHKKLADGPAEFEDFEKLKQAYEKWQKFAAENNFEIKADQGYKQIHNTLAEKDIEKNAGILTDLKDNPFVDYDRLRYEYGETQKQNAVQLTKELNGVYLDEDGEEHVTLLLLWLTLRTKQIAVLFEIKSELAKGDARKKKDLDKELLRIFGKIDKAQQTEDEGFSVPYEDRVERWWRETVNDALKRVLEHTKEDYLESVSKANRNILEIPYIQALAYKKDDYIKEIENAIGAATKKLKVLQDIEDKVAIEPQWLEDIKRLEISEKFGSKPLQGFLESQQFLDVISIPKERIQAKNLSEAELSKLLYAIPAIYDDINNESDLASMAISRLKKDLLLRINPVESTVVEYWERHCTAAFNEKNWEEFHKYGQIGKNFQAIVMKESPQSETARLFQEKYRDLVKSLYEGVIRVYSLELARDGWSGEATLAGFPISDNMENYWKWTQAQLGEYIKVFQEENIPKTVLSESSNKRYYTVIKNILEETQKQQKGQPTDFVRLQDVFKNIVTPWLILKNDKDIEAKLGQVKLEELGGTWTGKKVLEVCRDRFLPFDDKMKHLRPEDYESYVTHVFLKWHMFLEKDFQKWNELALNSLSGTLKSEYSKINKKFPFKVDSGEECTLKEVDEFFTVFSVVRQGYKVFLVAREEQDLVWKDLFDTCEKWQSTLYGKQTQFDLESAEFKIKIQFPKKIECGEIVDSIYFPGEKEKIWSLGKVQKDSFAWKWGEPLSLSIKFIGGVTVASKLSHVRAVDNNVAFEPAMASKNQGSLKQWEIFRFISTYQMKDKKEEKIIKKDPKYKRGKILLDFPYKATYRGNATNASLNLEVTFYLLGQEGEFDLPWEGK